MAETDADRRAAGTMTEEEADRLSEQFRPSWEEDPPTVPREQPVPAPPCEPRSKPASGPAVTTAPVVNITSAAPATVPESKPAVARAAAPLTVTPSRNPTLVGTAPPTPVVTRAAEGAPSEDLDWEVSTSQAADAEAPVQIEVEELPPESKPSGIGQKYVPKEEGAPAVVLGADVQAAETTERAKLEVEHRARRAPTMIRMNAFELPKEAAPAPELELAVPRKRSFGMVAALGVLVLGGGAAVALVVARSGSPPPAETHAASAPSATPAAVTPDTAAPAPPPTLPAAEPSASAPAPTPEAAAPASAAVTPVPMPAEPASTKPTRTTLGAKAAGAVAKSAGKAGSAKSAAKPAATAPKSPAKTGGKNTIVRETPF
jgi:hypothetical protein